ncbi:hypothetical protein CC78DRAFT_575074 [Lojkania enalia]|uniref:Uncharacterized protein n=1 Tax=Lojkania enalia TaxID=147567 RepID=A0A9P4NA95_9PLEO|nr:hypothetical protein CC78DRAFT_575074 [Didymosphaeria enalia]
MPLLFDSVGQFYTVYRCTLGGNSVYISGGEQPEIHQQLTSSAYTGGQMHETHQHTGKHQLNFPDEQMNCGEQNTEQFYHYRDSVGKELIDHDPHVSDSIEHGSAHTAVEPLEQANSYDPDANLLPVRHGYQPQGEEYDDSSPLSPLLPSHLGTYASPARNNGWGNSTDSAQAVETHTANFSQAPQILNFENGEDDSEDDVPLVQRIQKIRPESPTTQTLDFYPQQIKEKSKNDSDVEIIASPPKISWKLPSFEALYEMTTDGYPQAKVTLPGMPREYIFLSPDHSQNEFRLLQSLFLRSHQSLASPDPNPRIALLNFHTIAVLVLDSLSLKTDGWNPHNIDVDDLFLSILDNWRIGKEAGRKNYQMIRGVQEFIDIALEISWFIKEHGLLAEKKTRKERSDKGVKRVQNKNFNVLQPRKQENLGTGQGKKEPRGVTSGAKKLVSKKNAPSTSKTGAVKGTETKKRGMLPVKNSRVQKTARK